jgi:uncharacterized protein (DUF885 family)
MRGGMRLQRLAVFALIVASASTIGCRKRATHVRDPALAPVPVQQSLAGRLGETYLASLLRWSPESASALGLHANDDRLDDRSEKGVRAILDEEKVLLADVRAVGAGLDARSPDGIDLAVLLGALEADVLMREKLAPHRRMPDSYCEPLGALFRMATTEYGTPASRARAMLVRLAAVAPMLETAKTTLVNPPAPWTRIAIRKAKFAAEMFDTLHAFIDGALPTEKVQSAQAVDSARKAYADFASWLESDLLLRSTGEFAAGHVLFEGLLRANYALDETPDELDALGRRVMDETEKSLNEVARTIDPKAKHWSEVVARVKDKHPTAGDLVPAYRREVERARTFLIAQNVLTFPPGDDLVVQDTPPFLRATTQASYDQPAPFDATTRGFFFVTPVEPSWPAAQQEEWLRESDMGDVVDTAVHEAYPGHHLQLSIARRHPSLVRKAIGPSIFSEGWALYSEELMAELGYYAPHERLMQLNWTLVRAARVVIDVGIHTKNLPLDEAENILVNRVHLERSLAQSEVRRYSESPTQPLSYLVGREQIRALRERTRRLEGREFSLKRFHDRLLSESTVAPKLVERAWFGSH